MSNGQQAQVPMFHLLVGVVVLAMSTDVTARPPAAERAYANCKAASASLFGRAALEPGGNVEQPHPVSWASDDNPTCKTDSVLVGSWVAVELIGPDGAVHGLWVVKTPRFRPACPEWSAAVAVRVRRTKFSPARLDGVAVPVCMTVTASPILTQPEAK